MYSNFVTPPDIITDVLIVDATEEQIQACADACRVSESAYNVYFYNEQMAQLAWLEKVLGIADVVLVNAESALSVSGKLFGADQELVTPADYFDK
jgi:hypothetical protein